MKKLASIYRLVVPAALLLILIGCQSRRQVTEEEAPPAGKAEVDQRGFDPLEMPEDREVVPLKHPSSGEIVGLSAFVEDDDEIADTLYGETHIAVEIDSLSNQAFRVQLFTSKVYGDARQAHRVAQEIFDRPVFLDYEVPYYKLRVGNFVDRETAEEYLQRAKAAGYSDAWVVVVNIRVKEAAPLYDELMLPEVVDSTYLDSEEETVDDKP